jgi:ABC-2 type transport system permease protein
MIEQLGRRPTATVEGLGLLTLYLREVRRFMKVPGQTLMAPAVTTMLFMAIFSLALGRAVEQMDGIPFLLFLAPGLAMMAMLQNSFANASSSLIIAKVQGNIIDTLMPPLSPLELLLGIGLGAVTRGLTVGVIVVIAMQIFVAAPPVHLWAVLFYAVAACLMMGLIGMLVGIWAEKFDQIAATTNFLVTPLTFLSGTFYSVERLPDALQWIAAVNPFYYAIDGFRYGFIDRADGSLLTGVLVLAAVDLVLAALCFRVLQTGWRLKS